MEQGKGGIRFLIGFPLYSSVTCEEKIPGWSRAKVESAFSLVNRITDTYLLKTIEFQDGAEQRWNLHFHWLREFLTLIPLEQ